jgi:hypothetical protein
LEELRIHQAREALEEHRARIEMEEDKKHQAGKAKPEPQYVPPHIKGKNKQNGRDKYANRHHGGKLLETGI